MVVADETCRCGHARELHDHLRRGTDCAECGADRCATYRAADASGRVRRALARLLPRRAEPGVVLQHRSKASGRGVGPTTAGERATRPTGSGDVSKEA